MTAAATQPAPANLTVPRVGLVSLGCPKATWDSEQLVTRLRADGYALAATYDKADLVIVNTCGFIDSARAESLAAIGEALNENGRVIVTGCLGAKADDILHIHPRVLAVTGPQQFDAVLDAVHRHLPPPEHNPFLHLIPAAGLRLTPPHYAWLKISEGCNHHCTFCIIPALRGRLRSRPLGLVMREAETLVAGGVKELLVIAQDTSAYGLDTRYPRDAWAGREWRTDIHDLCRALGELGVWIRLHYVYPYPHVDRLLPLLAAGVVLPYLDVPLQHGSPRILKRMRRPAAAEDTLARIRAWRAICPELTLRSTFIVGFPGETEDDFAALLDFLEAAELDRVGCFKYSAVAGAAANELPDPVPEAVKDERYARFMQAQQKISAARLARRVGSAIEVVVDRIEGDAAVARSAGEAPEIDGVIRLYDFPAGLKPGDRCRARITGSDEYDLEAEMVHESTA